MNTIKKKWTNIRVYVYSLKSKKCLNKANFYLNLSQKHRNLALKYEARHYNLVYSEEIKENRKLCSEYLKNSEHYIELSNFYDKKIKELKEL